MNMKPNPYYMIDEIKKMNQEQLLATSIYIYEHLDPTNKKKMKATIFLR